MYSLRILPLLLFGMAIISAQMYMHNFKIAEATTIGAIWAINYHMAKNAKGYFQNAALIAFCIIQDAYKNSVPFTTLLAIFAYFDIQKLAKINLEQNQDEKVGWAEKTITFSIFYLTANLIFAAISNLMQNTTNMPSGLFLITWSFVSSVATSTIIYKTTGKSQTVGI